MSLSTLGVGEWLAFHWAHLRWLTKNLFAVFCRTSERCLNSTAGPQRPSSTYNLCSTYNLMLSSPLQHKSPALNRSMCQNWIWGIAPPAGDWKLYVLHFDALWVARWSDPPKKNQNLRDYTSWSWLPIKRCYCDDADFNVLLGNLKAFYKIRLCGDMIWSFPNLICLSRALVWRHL